MEKRFNGELKWIKPSLLVNENNLDKTESFFLVLGVIFNDLQGLILFEEMLVDNYEKPENKPTSHDGHYAGVLVQIQKLIASTINEFFVFLKINKNVLTTDQFKEIFNQLNKTDRQSWNAIIAAANNNLSSVTELLKSMVYIRSNFAFHYDHSGKILRRVYISRFFGNHNDEKADLAYYSIDNNIKNTRFYFADAAVEESLFIAVGKKTKESSAGNEALKRYQSQIRETINVISTVIQSLLKKYIQLKRGHPN